MLSARLHAPSCSHVLMLPRLAWPGAIGYWNPKTAPSASY